MFSLFKLDRDLSLSSKVCWALRSQVQNAASSFLEAAAGQLLYQHLNAVYKLWLQHVHLQVSLCIKMLQNQVAKNT